MPRFELKKTIEANELNPRTGVPIGGPPTNIPYGSVIDEPTLAWDFGEFGFLGHRYRCASDLLLASMEKRPIGEAPPAPPPPVDEATPARGRARTPAAPAADEPGGMQWERVKSSGHSVERAKVPGGWLVLIDGAAAFYPDAKYKWDGESAS